MNPSFSTFDVNESNVFINQDHGDIIETILNDQLIVSENMRVVLCQLSIYYQLRLGGDSHKVALDIAQQSRLDLIFDEEGKAEFKC